MKNLAQLASHRAWIKIKLPAVMLITLLQRTPVVRLLDVADEFVTASPVGNLLRSTLAAAASLGTLHSLAGATTLSVTPTSAAKSITVPAGSPISNVAFTVTNTINISSWRIAGNLPPGLSIMAVEGGASLTGPGTLDATTPGMVDPYDPYGSMTGGVSSTTPYLTGTPTQAGTYTFSLQAFEFAKLTGLASNTFNYSVTVTSVANTVSAPTVATQPVSQQATAGASVSLTAAASGGGTPTFQWQRNGSSVSGGTTDTLNLSNLQPSDAGLYIAQITNSAGSTTSDAAIVGIASTSKVIGTGTEIAQNIFVASNGNTFDQVLPSGPAVTVTADPTQITRTSFVDLTDDIVQVEFSGNGTASLVLDNPSGPALPVNYNQSTLYMKGHVGIVITGADDTTNVSVFSVGKITAVNQALFKSNVTYDGMADLAFIAISTTNGKFGGLRVSNGNFYAAKGMTGVYAPGVAFQGPVFIGDINASDAATPVIVIGSSPDTRITGGDLLQANGKPVQVSGLTQLKFTAGSTSNGGALNAQTNKGVLMQGGTDVTAQVVVNPGSP